MVNQTICGTCYSTFLTGLIHCKKIMLIVSDRVGSLGKGSWLDDLGITVRIQGRGLIFAGIMKAWVVCFVFTLEENSNEQCCSHLGNPATKGTPAIGIYIIEYYFKIY